jgi:hypothetical protein
VQGQHVDSRTLVMQTCSVLDLPSIPNVPYLGSFKNTEKHVLVAIVSFLSVRSVRLACRAFLACTGQGCQRCASSWLAAASLQLASRCTHACRTLWEAHWGCQGVVGYSTNMC